MMTMATKRLCPQCGSPLQRLEDAVCEVWVCSRRGDHVAPCRYVSLNQHAEDGVCCPRCHCRDLLKESRVTNTYDQPSQIRRRRVCRNCGKVVYTREVLEVKDS